MSVILWGLLWLLVGVLLFTAIALATPVKFTVSLRSLPHKQLKVQARLFGGLTPPVPLHNSDRSKKKSIRRSHDAKSRMISRRRTRGRSKTARIMYAGPDLVIGLLRPIHVEKLSIVVDFGLADPAATGEIYGMLTPLIYAPPYTSNISIAVRPDFDAPCLSGEIDARFSFIPLALVPPALQFAWQMYGANP